MKRFVRMMSMALALMVPAAFAAAADKTETFPIDHVLGKADAPITIIEYASTTCGHCANFHKTTLPKVKAEWIDTGKAKLIFRDFPTAPQPLSVGASMIAHCSGPDRYFGVLGLFMENQDKWLGAANPLDAIQKMVRLAGITADDVQACLQRNDLAQDIQARAEKANKDMDIDSTPTFLINGKKVVGYQDYTEFKKVLEQAAK